MFLNHLIFLYHLIITYRRLFNDFWDLVKLLHQIFQVRHKFVKNLYYFKVFLKFKYKITTIMKNIYQYFYPFPSEFILLIFIYLHRTFVIKSIFFNINFIPFLRQVVQYFNQNTFPLFSALFSQAGIRFKSS